MAGPSQRACALYFQIRRGGFEPKFRRRTRVRGPLAPGEKKHD